MTLKLTLLIVATFYLTTYLLSSIFKSEALFTMTFLNVGQGDSLLINVKKFGAILIDGGPDNSVELYARKFIQFPYCNLSRVYLTHFHSDHYMGLLNVLNRCSNTSTFNDIYVFSYSSSDFVKLYLSKELKLSRNLRINNLYSGDINKIPLADGTYIDIYILWPPKNYSEYPDENDRSLVMLLDYKDYEVLLTGDISGKILDNLIDNPIWQVIQNGLDVYKVPHHGSITGDTDRLINFLHPLNCVISVGDNKYGHPDARVIKELQANKCKIYRTDVEGNVVFTP